MRPQGPAIRSALAAWVLLGLASTVLRAQAVSGDQLLRRARAAQQAAQTDLAAARAEHLAERKALAADLQRAYDALATAKAEASAAREKLERLRAGAAAADRSAALAEYNIATLLVQAAKSAGVEVDPNAETAAMEETLWQGLADRIDRLSAAKQIRVATQHVVARSGEEADLPVLRLGDYAAYACGGRAETCGLLRATADGREVIVGPHLPGPHAEALRAAAAGQVTRIPVDVDGTLIDRAPAEPKGAAAWLETGGLFVYPILAVGALGLLLIADRLVYLARAKAPARASDVLACLHRGDPTAARELLPPPHTPMARVLRAAVEAAGKDGEQREAAMESALLAEAPKLERSLSLLGALAGVAPLLGLLGTVSGMIATFETIAEAGTGNPRLLSGGISEALITTQLGLMVAIPLLLAHAWLSRWVQRREAMLEYNAVQAFGTAHEGGQENGEP